MTIPANQLVNVIPNVLSAGGAGLTLNMMVLTLNVRVPYGSVLSFPSAAAVGAYFGLTSTEFAIATVYFNGFQGCSQFPSAILFAQYPLTPLRPYLRGGSAAGYSLAQLQTLAGTLTLTVNGVNVTSGNISLAASTSFSNAATTIQNAFNYFDAVTTATIAGNSGTSFIGSISGNILTVTSLSSGTLTIGGVLSGTGGGGVPANCIIVNQITGSTGSVGTYTVATTQSVSTSTMSQTYGLLTVSGVTSGTIAVGQLVNGTAAGLASGTITIAALAGGTGGIGAYVLSGGSASGTMSASTVNMGQLSVTYDSVSGAFLITGGTPGVAGTITQAGGSLAAGLFLTTATGGVLSQGAANTTPNVFMPLILTQTQNWATFMLSFNPDAFGNSYKLLFSAWTNNQVNRYAYLCWDTDVTPTQSLNASSSMGKVLAAANSSGTVLIYDPAPQQWLAAFGGSMAACTNFSAINGRITWAFKQQQGLTPNVTDPAIAANLIANGYNFYGAYATANQAFNFFQPGSISGLFQWADSYINQIWLNNSIQLALVNLLANTNSMPYTPPGYASVEASIAGQATQGLVNGVISAGVTLAANQVIQVNRAAGIAIDGILSSRGWYAQVQPATAQVRAARTTPPIFFWYTDGGSIQQMTVASTEVQ